MINVGTLLQELLSKFINAVPNFLSALVIIGVGFIVAKILRKTLVKVLEKLGIDKIGEKLNSIDIVSKANMEIKLSNILSKLVYYFVLLIFIVAGTDVLGMPALSELVMKIFDLIPNIIVAGVILVVGILVADALRNLVLTTCQSLGIPSAKVISMFVFYFIVINVLISALTQAQVNTAFLSQNISLVIGGAVLAFSIGYGLASRDTVSNYLSASYASEKIKEGDRIIIDGVEGTIVNMDKSAVELQTAEGKVFIPMHHLSKSRITVL